MTFSILARCHETGAFGVAVTSSSIAVASRCGRWAQAGVGAVATQNITDPALGAIGLDLLARGYDAQATLNSMLGASSHSEFRQLAVLDAYGRSAYHRGRHTLGIHAMASRPGCVACGNLLANDAVPEAMVAAFEAQPQADFAERVLSALEAGLAAGGETAPVNAAGLWIVERLRWPVIDLRVDWQEEPIAELRRIFEVYRPQKDDYVLRAIDPARAPGFASAGDCP